MRFWVRIPILDQNVFINHYDNECFRRAERAGIFCENHLIKPVDHEAKLKILRPRDQVKPSSSHPSQNPPPSPRRRGLASRPPLIRVRTPPFSAPRGLEIRPGSVQGGGVLTRKSPVLDS